MNLASYRIFTSEDKHIYWFISTGTKWNALKAVTIDEMGKPNRYNFGLADFINDDFNYNHVSDNNDLDTILGTLVKIAFDFTQNYEGCELFLAGNTPVKTRLYQIKISNNLAEISEKFEVFGMFENGEFTIFTKGEKYYGILLIRK